MSRTIQKIDIESAWVLQCVVVYCRVLQCVAVCCSVLQSQTIKMRCIEPLRSEPKRLLEGTLGHIMSRWVVYMSRTQSDIDFSVSRSCSREDESIEFVVFG